MYVQRYSVHVLFTNVVIHAYITAYYAASTNPCTPRAACTLPPNQTTASGGDVAPHTHWLTAPEEDVNGPYDQATMQAWEASGQFAAGAEFRRVGETEWSRLLDFED